MKKDDEQYSDQEAQQRFLGTLKVALKTPPKHKEHDSEGYPSTI